MHKHTKERSLFLEINTATHNRFVQFKLLNYSTHKKERVFSPSCIGFDFRACNPPHDAKAPIFCLWKKKRTKRVIGENGLLFVSSRLLLFSWFL
jgi:hypothetical protein